MDRPLDKEFVKTRNTRRIVRTLLIVGALIGLYLLITAWVSPSVSRSDIRIAKVYGGKFEATLSAAGTVVPEFEEVLTSPIETRVLKVLKNPGERLAKGDQILLLDMSELTLGLDRAGKDLSLKENQLSRLKLDMERAGADLRSKARIKELNLTYLRSKTAQQEKMFNIGAISKDQFDQVTMEENIAKIEYEDLEQTAKNTAASYQSQLDGLATEAATMRKECGDLRRQIAMVECRASRDGLLAWAAKDIGAVIHKGEPMAKIADLSGYRLDAQISDINASRIAIGQPVRVRINETYLDGSIANIFPTIEDGVAKFTVALRSKANPLLRANLRVDVFVVISGKERSLLVEKGPFVTGEATQELFLVQGDKAVRVPAQIGATSFDRVEILSGVRENDEIIISDMKEYLHLKEFRIK